MRQIGGLAIQHGNLAVGGSKGRWLLLPKGVQMEQSRGVGQASATSRTALLVLQLRPGDLSTRSPGMVSPGISGALPLETPGMLPLRHGSPSNLWRSCTSGILKMR